MRLQNIVFLVLLAIVFQCCYSIAGPEDEKSAPPPEGKDSKLAEKEETPSRDDNYQIDNFFPKDYYDKPSYKNDGYNGKSSYKNDDYNGKSSYNDDDYNGKSSYNDDDYNGKSSYNNDDYNGKSSYKDDDYNDKPSYKDDDYKPSEYRSSRRRKSPNDLGHMNIYVREPSKDGKRRKPKRFRMPVARYTRERFPSFGPLISLLPWLPIFTDRLTKQTFIYSPTGGVYILPPLINFFGRLISVAELIASGYASLVSTGVPPPPAVDVAPLVQPGPVVGPGVPVINPATGGFKGGVKTEYRTFGRPKYPKDVEEDDVPQRDQERSYSGNSYRSRSRAGYDDVVASDN